MNVYKKGNYYIQYVAQYLVMSSYDFSKFISLYSLEELFNWKLS